MQATMIKKNITTENVLIFIAFFFIGSYWFKAVPIALLLLLLVILLRFDKLKAHELKSFNLHFSTLLLLLFFFFYFSFDGMNSFNYDLYSSIKITISMVIIFIFTYLSVKSMKDLYIILLASSLGILFKSAFILWYTVTYDPTLLLHRKLLNPFFIIPKMINSNGIAIGAVFSSVIAMLFLLSNKGIKTKFFYLIIISIGLLISTILEARALFFILAIIFLVIILIKFSFKRYIKFLLISSILLTLAQLFSSTAVFEDSTLLNTSFENLEQRLNEKGAESPRYLLWIDGIENIFKYPFGGGKVDQSIDTVPYFHNFWLDIVRTSGVISLVVILFFQLYYLKTFKNLYSILLLIGTYLVFMIEVPLEGTRNLFLFFLILYASNIKIYDIERRI